MSAGIHLIIPMGGKGSRFSECGFAEPKPLLILNGKPFFYWATQSIKNFVTLKSLTFVVLKEHIEGFAINEIIHSFYPEANIVVLDHVLNGAVLTCVEGVKHITDERPVVFNDCDHMFFCSEFNEFCEKGDFNDGTNGALLTFPSDNSKFSFLRLDVDGSVIGTVEKQAVSPYAICGAYYFRNKKIFDLAVNQYLRRCDYSEFFVSGLYNFIAEEKTSIRNFTVDMHVTFGTPEEYLDAKSCKEFERFI